MNLSTHVAVETVTLIPHIAITMKGSILGFYMRKSDHKTIINIYDAAQPLPYHPSTKPKKFMHHH